MRLIDADKLLANIDSRTMPVMARHDIEFWAECNAVDPVHAAGGMRCGECKYLRPIFRHDITCEVVDYCCPYYGSIKKTDFCSKGVKKEAQDG